MALRPSYSATDLKRKEEKESHREKLGLLGVVEFAGTYQGELSAATGLRMRPALLLLRSHSPFPHECEDRPHQSFTLLQVNQLTLLVGTFSLNHLCFGQIPH